MLMLQEVSKVEFPCDFQFLSPTLDLWRGADFGPKNRAGSCCVLCLEIDAVQEVASETGSRPAPWNARKDGAIRHPDYRKYLRVGLSAFVVPISVQLQVGGTRSGARSVCLSADNRTPPKCVEPVVHRAICPRTNPIRLRLLPRDRATICSTPIFGRDHEKNLAQRNCAQ
jgi:hypothetical protein